MNGGISILEAAIGKFTYLLTFISLSFLYICWSLNNVGCVSHQTQACTVAQSNMRLKVTWEESGGDRQGGSEAARLD